MELTFVYLSEGCGKTQAKINDTIPNIVVGMGYQGTESTYPHKSTRSECCSVRPLALKTTTFSVEDLRKPLSQIWNTNGSTAWLYKSKHFSFTTTLTGILQLKR